MQRIIVNADDFGISHEVNIRIQKYLVDGVVTSSTIMAGGLAFDEAIAIAKTFQDKSFGVHLYIDELKPLTDNGLFKKYGMVDEQGFFVKGAYQKIKGTKEIREAIKEEWKAQIITVKKAGITISHLDSHHHCHTFSYLEGIVEDLAKEFEINKVRLNFYTPIAIKRKQQIVPLNSCRLSCNQQKKSSKLVTVSEAVIRHYERWQTNRKMKHSFICTDFFCELRYYYKNHVLLKQYDTIEVMCHPGHPSYESETVLLDSFRFDGVNLISYKDL